MRMECVRVSRNECMGGWEGVGVGVGIGVGVGVGVLGEQTSGHNIHKLCLKEDFSFLLVSKTGLNHFKN